MATRKVSFCRAFCESFQVKSVNTQWFFFRFFSGSFGTDINYIPASKIISSWLFYANQEKESGKTTYFNLPLNAAHVEIIFQHENSPSNEWIPLCGFVEHFSFAFPFFFLCKISFFHNRTIALFLSCLASIRRHLTIRAGEPTFASPRISWRTSRAAFAPFRGLLLCSWWRRALTWVSGKKSLRLPPGAQGS